MWPPPTASHPIVPAPPGTPPGTIWPSPGVPSHPIGGAGGGRPDQGLPGQPDQGLPPGQGGKPDQGLPPAPDQGLPGGSGGRPSQGLPSNVFWVVAGIPGIGWRYVAVDPSLSIGHTPPQGMPAPKR